MRVKEYSKMNGAYKLINYSLFSPLGRHRGFPTGANVVHPVGRAEASVARLFSGAV